MAYRMTALTDEVKVGINGRGELHIEIILKDDAHNEDPMEAFVPADALSALQEYIARNA